MWEHTELVNMELPLVPISVRVLPVFLFELHVGMERAEGQCRQLQLSLGLEVQLWGLPARHLALPGFWRELLVLKIRIYIRLSYLRVLLRSSG